MASSITLIQSVSVPSTQASMSFTSIPATYTDLKVVFSARGNRAGNGDYLFLNLNGARNNSGMYIKGYTGTTESGTGDENYLGIPSAGSTTNVFGVGEIYLPNYRSTTVKTVSAEAGVADNAGTNFFSLGDFTWTSGSASTGAITSITLTARFASIVQYSTAYLYGISNS